jgi:hypothetical protein
MAAVQDVLVANGATLEVRVIANKRSPAVESLLAGTACSTADLAACATLMAMLATQDSNIVAGLNATPSDLVKLQAGSDALWSTLTVETAQVSILE